MQASVILKKDKHTKSHIHGENMQKPCKQTLVSNPGPLVVRQQCYQALCSPVRTDVAPKIQLTVR